MYDPKEDGAAAASVAAGAGGADSPPDEAADAADEAAKRRRELVSAAHVPGAGDDAAPGTYDADFLRGLDAGDNGNLSDWAYGLDFLSALNERED